MPFKLSRTRLGVVTLLIAGGAVFFSAALAQAAPDVPSPAPAPSYTDAVRLIDAWLGAELAYARMPGFSGAIVAGQQVIWSKGYGTVDAAHRLPATPETIYSICSISKLFTSVAIMQLWEGGRLSLDDDIGKHLGAFAIRRTDPDSGPITIRSMLMHASGLPREAEFAYWTPPDFKFPSRAELMQKLPEQSTMMRASDRHQYSNLAMSLLGEVVVAVSGMPYDAYVQANILSPLRLGDTRTAMPMTMYGQRLAQGFGSLKRDGTRDLLKPFDTGGLTAAAGFTSTALDLARFASWQLRLLKNGGTEVLRASTLREMQRMQWVDADGKNTWGLGFAVRRDGPTTVVSHSGLCPGYIAAVSVLPKEELAVIAMANGNGPGGAGHYAVPMRRLLVKGKGLVPSSAPGAPDLAAYAGRYDAQPWSAELIIVPWGPNLAAIESTAADPADSLQVLQHVSGDAFRAKRDDGSLAEEWRFERGPDGRVVGLRSDGQRYPKLPP